MKKIAYCLFAGALVVMSACQEEKVQPKVPAQSGDEIQFGSSLSDGLETRTVYDDQPTDGYYRVSWEADGSDQISIYCPQASNGTLVAYSVSPDQNDPTKSSTVTKVNPDEAGLQWGEADTHHFYAFYPASAVTGTEDGKIRGTVPTTQNVVKWNQENNGGGTTYYGVANTDYAYMWAYGSFQKSVMGNQDVPLTFHPWMTILEIEINGPDNGTMKISNVNIRATAGTQSILAGDFICDMTPVEADGINGVPNYEAVGSTTGEVRNTISISCWNSETDDFIELGPGDKAVVRAFLLPIDEGIPNARQLQIRVQPMNGAVLTRTLGYSNTTGGVLPHRVNKVILPNLRSAGTNYWMTSLDQNIYLSELSLPGSKFSYLTPTNAGNNAAFQNVDIAQQFVDGVRAFIIQVGANATYNGNRVSIGNYDYTYTDATLPIYCGGGDDLSDAITDIANALATAEQANPGNHECAVVMLTYAGDNHVSANFTGDQPLWGASIGDVGGAERVWMDAIAQKLKDLGQDTQNRIFTDEVTANTTLGEVAGKIILKVNTNSDAQNEYIVANDNVPALFSRWNGAMNTVALRWGSPNTASTRQALNWMYQEATHVGDDTEITAANKIAYINQVFVNSVDAYIGNAAHDTWFMNDCGGTFHHSVSGAGIYSGDYDDGDTNDQAPIALAQWINPQVTAYLQERTDNASLGLVFFNFADKQESSGAQYGTDNLIQTVIDNNFKFNLRTAGSSTESTFDASYTNGGAAWE